MNEKIQRVRFQKNTLRVTALSTGRLLIHDRLAYPWSGKDV